MAFGLGLGRGPTLEPTAPPSPDLGFGPLDLGFPRLVVWRPIPDTVPMVGPVRPIRVVLRLWVARVVVVSLGASVAASAWR